MEKLNIDPNVFERLEAERAVFSAGLEKCNEGVEKFKATVSDLEQTWVTTEDPSLKQHWIEDLKEDILLLERSKAQLEANLVAIGATEDSLKKMVFGGDVRNELPLS